MCNCKNYKEKYENLLEIEKAHKEENGRLRNKIKELEANNVDLVSVYINGVYDERERWVKKIKENREFFNKELLKRLLTNYEWVGGNYMIYEYNQKEKYVKVDDKIVYLNPRENRILKRFYEKGFITREEIGEILCKREVFPCFAKDYIDRLSKKINTDIKLIL